MKEYLFKVSFEDNSIAYIPVLAPSVGEARKIFQREHANCKCGSLADFSGKWCLLGVYRAVSQ